ncbi:MULTISPECIES: ribonuclease D [Thiothrix]|jgi:ribonuclease D|uniref:Ribonuclease D n=2 Tax=Thiothrix TaxID=1030 RepID=A0A975II12_9GAMM|nr:MULTISPECIES: ribonuclease D [Thiothrix]OQX09527.1 MAG: ribonuclease D [Thiothrix lacustris]QTR53240.1 ribonuclease D [Thiothrix unzii]
MFEYISTPQQLNDLMTRLDNAEWVTLDTEFIREKTYFPRLCLIQIGSTDTLACIDPLAITDLRPFLTWLQDPKRLKVLHAAWQDMEIFHHLGQGELPSPLFDTQIAAAVLGMGDQMGYARLVEGVLGITLDKSQSRTDWSRRPLSKAQLEYAIDDVRHLRDVYLALREQLQQLGRMKWLDKPFQKLADANTYNIDPQTCWERIRGLQVLKPHQLAVLRELAAWREQRALQKDLPRRWLLSDEILLDMARMQPDSAEGLRHIRGLSDEQIERGAAEWLGCIARGKAVPKSEWPNLPRRRKLDENMSVVADLLTAVLNQIANENGISAQMIATRQQLEKMLEEGRTTLSDDWRGALVNDAFTALLSGKAQVSVQQQRVVIAA